MKNKIWWFVLAAVLTMATGCSDDNAGSLATKTTEYKIAVVMPFSSGSHWQRTVDWAISNFGNAQQGLSAVAKINVEMKDENDADLDAYLEKVASDDNYVAIIGPYSSEKAELAAKCCDKKSKTLILPIATSTEFQRSYANHANVWHLAQSDLTQCEILLMQAKVSESSMVCLLTADNSYGKSFSDWFAYQAIELGLNVGEIRTYQDADDIANSVDYFADRQFKYSTLIFAPATTSDFIAFDKAYTKINAKDAPTVYCSDVAHSQALVGAVSGRYEGISPCADPASGFINAYKEKFGEEPMAGDAHLYDAITLLGYALSAHGSGNLNEAITAVVEGRDTWNKSWLPADMHDAIVQLQAGRHPDLSGVTGDWTFDEKNHTSMLNTSYCHWTLSGGRYSTMEYLSTDGSGRTTSSLQIWQEEAKQFQEFNKQQEDFNYGTKDGNWAVVIGTSDTWANYRHQADAIAMYQILKRHGYDDDHIIMIIADNIANNPKNLYPGTVKVTPDGENLYHDIKVDYKIGDITVSDLKAIMTGQQSARLATVLGSGANDNVIVFWCGHGSSGSLAWGSDGSVGGWQMRNILQEMHDSHRYRKMFFAMDACYSGAIAESCAGIPGLLFMTAANAQEPSKADMKDPEMGVWLSNGFTRAFQDAIDENPGISLRDLYYAVARRTVGSHATVYNIEQYGNMYNNTMAEFFK